MARLYAINSEVEAKAYLVHPILGKRLEKCCRIVGNLIGQSAQQIFGHTDALKFCSSMTLFASVANQPSIFNDILGEYYGGKADQSTLDILHSV